MKASEIKKESKSIESIYDEINGANSSGQFKHFIPHFVYVEESTIMKLIDNGFKVHKGNWDIYLINCWIIEW